MIKINPKKLVCIIAHPDDEAFGPSGSIAYFASRGTEITIICATNGDADWKYNKFVSGDKLSKIRAKELINSAKILGVKNVEFLDFKDGSLNNNIYHEVANKIKPILQRIKPDTILTGDNNGVSGHIDHAAVSLISSYLYERLSFIKTILYFCESKEFKEKIGKNYFVYFPQGYTESQVDLVLDVSKFVGIKKKALWAHKSQRTDAIIATTIYSKFLGEEYFKVLTK